MLSQNESATPVRKATDELLSIPGVGKSIAADLRQIGVHQVADLENRDPEELYRRSNAKAGMVQDRCLLYVFRCAVYYANGGRNPEQLKWWNWKDTATKKQR
ncbi:MAG: helix-hairpin-helix domain-containing protein [bacterium]|nr:helix-hairpin-helix domain-containing protein [bacterium]